MSVRSVSSSLSRSADAYFLRVHLDVVALEEDRPLEALAQRRGEHAGDVFVRALLGVANLGPCDLEDEGPARAAVAARIAARAV
jgi:hypothetical protein